MCRHEAFGEKARCILDFGCNVCRKLFGHISQNVSSDRDTVKVRLVLLAIVEAVQTMDAFDVLVCEVELVQTPLVLRLRVLVFVVYAVIILKVKLVVTAVYGNILTCMS